MKDVVMGRVPSIPKEITEQYKSIEPIIELSKKCCIQDPSKRPTYHQILDQLLTLKQIQHLKSLPNRPINSFQELLKVQLLFKSI